MLVNYSESILSYISSIRKYLNLSTNYNSNESFDTYLNDLQPKRVFLILIDGMGLELIKRKLSKDSFLLQHLYCATSTVFPPTTVAATTSIRNGLSPNQNAWLGWCQYFKEEDDEITLFLDEGYYSKKQYDKDYAYKHLPISFDTVKELKDKAIDINPYYIEEGGYDGLDEFVERIIEASYSDKKYIYAYYDKYDSTMHKYGTDDIEADELLKEINQKMAELANKVADDTLLIMVADHGLININQTINLYETKFKDYLARAISLEPRASALFIKEDKKDIFAKEFKETYGDDFILLSKDEVIESHLFGDFNNHERFNDFIGDYIAIAKRDKDLVSKDIVDFKMMAAHAGMTQEELMIPIITYIKRGKEDE